MLLTLYACKIISAKSAKIVAKIAPPLNLVPRVKVRPPLFDWFPQNDPKYRIVRYMYTLVWALKHTVDDVSAH